MAKSFMAVVGGCGKPVLGVWVQPHTPNIAFRHLPLRKDVVNQCLEFGSALDAGWTQEVRPMTQKGPSREPFLALLS